jgi:hypothetical protein
MRIAAKAAALAAQLRVKKETLMVGLTAILNSAPTTLLLGHHRIRKISHEVEHHFGCAGGFGRIGLAVRLL